MGYARSLRATNKPTAHIFAPEILREYDIRGQINKNLSEADAYALGRSFAVFLKQKTQTKPALKTCVGYDGRISSPELEKALIEGLMDSGITVINIGLGPTPMLYFAVKHLKADAGIMVTGSHNPADYNGFKITLSDHPVFGPDIKKIGDIAAKGDFIVGASSLEKYDIAEEYVQRLLQDLTQMRPLTIAWDCGNGASGKILQNLTRRMSGKHILLYDEIDGRFPNHHPDPTVDNNLRDLQKAVQKYKCDLGIAFDGDADRIGIVDENGTIIRCDTLMMIYAHEVLTTYPGATIIGDVKCSSVLFDEIKRLGGNPVMWKTGHSVMKDKMQELKAPLAGELSGHIFFADKYYGFDDALYCAIRLLNALPENGTLSDLTKHLPTLFNTPEIRIDVKEEEKFDLIPKILNNLDQKNMQINTIDGLRVTMDEGWFLLRPSNTQNVLVARAESTSPQGLENLIKIMREQIEKLGYSLPQ